MPARPPIPISVVTGFLGAGKTTLLNGLLSDPALVDTAVIVNEFGEVGIDHMLVESASDGVIELSDGCLCCSVRGELVDTLTDLVGRVDDGRIARLGRVIVETTGLADPVPVLQAIIGHPLLSDALRLDGVIALVDAVNAETTLDAHEEAVRQVAVADRIVLAKTDLAEGAAGLPALRRRLVALNPTARIVEAASGGANHAALFDCGLYDPKTKTADVERWLGEAGGRMHDRPAGHDAHAAFTDRHHRHHHHHDERVRAFTLVHAGPLPFTVIENFLDLLRAAQGESLLRMKGVIELAEDPERPLVIHGVRKLLHPPARLAHWPQGPRGTRIVLITMDVSEDYVRRLFAAFTGAPQIDTPDRTAVEANPLAIPGFPG